MYSARAVRLKGGPVIPGAAAKAAGASNSAVSTAARSSCVCEIAFFMFITLIAALLIDPDFRHKSAEILGIVGQMIEIRGVEVIHVTRVVLVGVAGIQDHVQRLTTSQRDRIGFVIEIIARLISQ